MIGLAGPMLAGSLARGSLATSNLAVVSAQSRLAAALVHSFAFAIVQAGDDTLREFAAQSIVPFGAFTFVLLDTLSAV